MQQIDDFLNRITMYRLVLYLLIGLVGAALILGFLGLLPYSPFDLGLTVAFLVSVGVVTNAVFARVFSAPTNVESVYISALILALIIPPFRLFDDVAFLFWAAVWTMAGKFILAVNKKHIFNPVALAVAVTALFLGRPANWWVGTGSMLPFVLASSFLIVRKIRRSEMVVTFLLTTLATSLILGRLSGADLLTVIKEELISSPLFFFAGIMFTEPLTTPPTKLLQQIYAVFVGVLFAPQIHLGSFYLTPELSLLAGNIFSYLVSPRVKMVLRLDKIQKIAPDVYDLIFQPDQRLAFTPGQYMEWTLPHPNPDSRGNRRYFTLASSPTEGNLRIGVKFPQPVSSFKKNLLQPGKEIVASQLAGDFVLPGNRDQKIVLIAGGIGITPFRSMLKYLIDRGERRPITLIYSNEVEEDIIYRDVFDEASKLGLKVVYTLTRSDHRTDWQGRVGRVDEQMILEEVPDYRESLFYVSGSHSLVTAMESLLLKLGIPRRRIKSDYFPGFA